MPVRKVTPLLAAARAAALSLIAACAAAPALAQEQQPQPQQPAATSPEPAEAKPDAAAAANAYRIGTGDVLDIVVTTGSGRSSQLSAENLTVNENGVIQVFDGTISASCLTADELAASLKARYLKYKKEPLSVVVNVKEYRSQLVAVIGAVKAPGRFELRRPIRLLELLALYANGPNEKSDGRIEIVHTRDATVCGAQGGGPAGEDARLVAASHSYDWEDTRLGRDEANPYVRPGDVISLSEAPEAFVIGNVHNPMAIPLRDKVTLTTALAMAGGLMENTKASKIRIERRKPGSTSKDVLVADLNAIKKQQSEDVVLQPGDIVEVPTSTGGRIISRLLGAISPVATQATVRVIR